MSAKGLGGDGVGKEMTVFSDIVAGGGGYLGQTMSKNDADVRNIWMVPNALIFSLIASSSGFIRFSQRKIILLQY